MHKCTWLYNSATSTSLSANSLTSLAVQTLSPPLSHLLLMIQLFKVLDHYTSIMAAESSGQPPLHSPYPIESLQSRDLCSYFPIPLLYESHDPVFL